MVDVFIENETAAAERPTNEQLAARFLRRFDNPHTAEAYTLALRRFFDYHEGHVLDATSETIKAANAVYRRRFSPKANTHNVFYAAVRSFYTFLCDVDLYRGRNPAKELQKRVVVDRIQPTPCDAEIARVWEMLLDTELWDEATPDERQQIVRDRAVFALFVGCGLRVCEMLPLRVEHFDLANHRLELPYTKGGEENWMPIPVEALPFLTAFLTGRKSGEPAFVGDTGKPVTTRKWFNIWLTRLCDAVDIPRYGPHALRRWAGTKMIAATDPESARKFLRHASLATTIKYDANRKVKPSGMLGLPEAG